jgi:5'-3' exonuclease
MKLHLVDGTFELFRAHFGAPPATAPDGRDVGAVRGLLRSLLALLGDDTVTHVGVAFDHVIECFRNELFPGYKTGEGVPAELMAQFELAERATHALGVVVWPMVEFETDDALAAAAARWADAEGVDQVVICSPDKDLAQCVRGTRVVTFDRLRRELRDEDGVVAKFGVRPASIPDWLALVGDSADGIPGVRGWGAKSAAAVLARYGHVEAVPDEAARWDVSVRGAERLGASLRAAREDVRLYKTLATLRTDVPLAESLGDLEWRGARRGELEVLAGELGDDGLPRRIARWRD